MKKFLTFITAVILLMSLSACGKETEGKITVRQELYGTILADDEFFSAKDNMEAGKATGMQLYVANGADFVITNQEVISELWNLLGKVSAGEAVSEPGIDDGLIVFNFLFDDYSSYMVSFMTSDYVYGDDSTYEVNNPKIVSRAYKIAMAEEK